MTTHFSSLYARPPVDTGSIYGQIKDNSQDTLKERSHPKYKKNEKSTRTYAQQGVLIRGFKVIGNDEFSQKEIDQALSAYLGKRLPTSQLPEIAETLADYYHRKGFFDASVAIIYPYVLEGGIVVLQVDERHLEPGGISVENNGSRIKTQKILDLWNHIMKPGPMKQDEYERAMLLTNDLPGISAKADLYYGTAEGTNDLVITIKDESVFNGNVDFDNFGSYYTGEYQAGATLYWNSPTGNGEEIVARLVSSGKYSNYGYIDFSLPVYYSMARIGASFDYLDYELTHEPPGEEGDGSAWNVTLYGKYPIVRTELSNLEMELDYVHVHLKDNNASTQIDDTDIDKVVLRLSGNHQDQFLLNGISYVDLSVTYGHLKLKNAEHRIVDELLYGTRGNFSKLNFNFTRYQNIVGDLSAKLSAEGQWASRNLDSSEKYFVGGPYSVAGYPVGEAAGDHGLSLYAGLMYDFYEMPWGGDFRLSAFYTNGWVRQFKSPNDALKNRYPLYADDNDVRLQSVGLGFSQSWGDFSMVRLVVGRQVGSNSLRKYSDGKDYDQSDSNYRVWAETIFYW